MTPQQCSQLFMPFAQVDGSASRKYGGTGIGLAMASKLAELMDGRIWVNSELGQGSVFHVELRFGLTQSTACILLDEKSKEEQVLATTVTPALASETPLPDLENELGSR
jgi:signal transduction histidine kinase